MPQFIVDVIAEQVQKEHIPGDMHKAGVHKSISDKLPQVRSSRRKHKMRKVQLRPRQRHKQKKLSR